MSSTGASGEAALPLVGKKLMQKLGGMANEAAAANVSDFAQRQMAKMGWSAGKGLGKREQGVTSHIKVKKREELQGVGADKAGVEESKSQWWYNVYDRMAGKIQVDASDDDGASDAKKRKKKAKKDKKRKREASASANANTGFRIPTDEELFAATGGKLFGRRAYGSCVGKLKRDELHVAGHLKLNSDEKAARKAKKQAKQAKRAKKEADKADKQEVEADKRDGDELETPATTSSDGTEEEEPVVDEQEQARKRKRAKKVAKKHKQQQEAA